MHNLVIYGAGRLGLEVAEIIWRINARHRIWNFLGFVDDSICTDLVWRDYGVLGGRSFIKDYSDPLDVVLAISSPQSKRLIYSSLKEWPFVNFPVVIDIDVVISQDAFFDEGVVISHFCSVSLDVKLGKCVFLNTGSHIGHNTSIGDFCSVMPNADISGDVRIGDDTLIGARSVLLQGIEVGSCTKVGIGSVVLGNIPGNCTVLGNPACRI